MQKIKYLENNFSKKKIPIQKWRQQILIFGVKYLEWKCFKKKNHKPIWMGGWSTFFSGNMQSSWNNWWAFLCLQSIENQNVKLPLKMAIDVDGIKSQTL